MLLADQVLNKGRYRIVNNFGHDGGGTYEAYDTVSNTKVVLKETVGSLGKVTTTSQLEASNLAFFGGAQTLAESRHESLVSVQDYFADLDRQYLVLEPVAELDLGHYLTGNQRPDPAAVLSWADQLLDALQYLHTRQTPIIHGDVRPENVKLTADSKVKLLVSCPHVDANANLITLAPAQSVEDGVVNYRPLEQLWNGLDALSQRVILNHYDEESERWLLRPLSAATDLYSLAATLYAVLTGTVPQDALDRSIAALEGKPDPLVSLSEANPAVTHEVADVIMKAMSLRREDRFYSAAILRQILHTASAKVKESVSEPNSVAPAAVDTEMPQTVSDADAIRMEIEADRKRLEQERIALEKRQAELDAELAAQKAEQERLERVAAEERQKLEEKRVAAETARENQRLAEEQAARDAESAKLQAEAEAKRNAESTRTETPTAIADPDEDDEDLLEVPKTLAARASASAPLPIPPQESTSDFLSLDNEQHQAGSKWRLPAVAVAIVIIAAVSFGIWKMSSGAPAAASNSVSTQPVAVPQQPDPTLPADTQNSPDPSQSSVADTQQLTSAPATVADKSPKTVSPPVTQEKPKKQPTPAPAKTPAAKKAVTVDDLINDH